MNKPLRFIVILSVAISMAYVGAAPKEPGENDQAKKSYLRGLELLRQGLCADDKDQIGLEKIDPRTAFENPDSLTEFKPKPTAKEGLKLIIEAYDLGEFDAGLVYAQCMKSGIILAEDYQGAISLLGKLASKGHAASQYILAQELMNGRLAGDRSLLKQSGTRVPTDVEAFSLFLKAAESGHALAQNSVAVCYQRGVGTERDPKASFKWAKRSAYAGCYAGQATLGVHYINGDAGVDRDFDTAYAWFKIASDSGNLASGIYSERIKPQVDRKRSAEIEAVLRKELAASPTAPKR